MFSFKDSRRLRRMAMRRLGAVVSPITIGFWSSNSNGGGGLSTTSGMLATL